MAADTDPEQIARARSGDAAAFDALVEARIRPMLRTATAILGTEADARDAVQDALLMAWRELAALRDPAAFDAWLTRILVNRCRRGLRRIGLTQVREVRVERMDVRDEPRTLDPADPVADRVALERAFDRLSVEDRTLLVLHHLEGRSIASIAEVLRVPEGTAKSRLFAARRALGRALEREHPR